MEISVFSRVDGLGRKAESIFYSGRLRCRCFQYSLGQPTGMPLHLEHVTVGDSLVEAQLSSGNNLEFLMAF